jgi:hypothetical protein
MRTQLHAELGEHRKRGRWLPVDKPFRPWVRVGVALIVLLLIMVAGIVLAGGARASAGCSTRSRTYAYRAPGGARLWWTEITASGCWNAANTKVTSFSAGGSGGANTPYRYDGITGRQPVGGVGQHQAGMVLTYRIEMCIPFVGCSVVAQPKARIILDSYGNWDIRNPF